MSYQLDRLIISSYTTGGASNAVPFGDTLVLGTSGDDGTEQSLFGDELYVARDLAPPVNWGDGAPTGDDPTGPYLGDIMLIEMPSNSAGHGDGDVVAVKGVALAVSSADRIDSDAADDFML